MAAAAPELSAVVLCYRAEENAHRVIDPLHEQLEGSGLPYELILVANYWPEHDDRTPDVVREFAAARSSVRAVAQSKAGDAGWDLRSGLSLAHGSHLVFLDGDGQVDVDDVIETYRCLVETGADIVKGRRAVREDGTARTITSLVYNAMFRVLFGTRGLWDVNGQPKGMTRAAYAALDLRSDDWFIDAEIVLKGRELGLRIVERPVRFRANVGRKSLVGWDTVWEFLVNMARWRFGSHPARFKSRPELYPGSSSVPDRAP